VFHSLPPNCAREEDGTSGHSADECDVESHMAQAGRNLALPVKKRVDMSVSNLDNVLFPVAAAAMW
jgi:hypothetical protein